MVSIAFVLLTVLTLAVHGKIASTEGPVVPSGCEGKTFCNIKPDDYPQNEIDHYLESNPAHLQRLKRHAESNPWTDSCQAMSEQMAELEDGSEGGNCRVQRIECYYPYKMNGSGDSLSQVLVQSEFFKQAIPKVVCAAPETPCLRDFTRHQETKCEQIAISTTVFVWNELEKIVQDKPATLYIDCGCILIRK